VSICIRSAEGGCSAQLLERGGKRKKLINRGWGGKGILPKFTRKKRGGHKKGIPVLRRRTYGEVFALNGAHFKSTPSRSREGEVGTNLGRVTQMGQRTGKDLLPRKKQESVGLHRGGKEA